MSTAHFRKILSTMVIVALLIPGAFLALPQRASASGGGMGCIGGVLGGLLGAVSTLITVPVGDTANTTVNSGTWGATIGSCINEVILIPLARAIIHAMLQQMTASIVNTINGKNPAGTPQYVTNLPRNLQSIGDRITLSFISQFQNSIRSPFAPAIASALRTNYLQGSSLAGFFAANQDTLSRHTSDANAFLSGNFRKGGWEGWFALTTQDQNNPYSLYSRAQSQLGRSILSSQANQRQTIAQNGGFLSWCSGGSSEGAVATGAACKDFENSSDCQGELVCVKGSGALTTGTCQVPTSGQSDAVTSTTCINKDGTPGTIQTPGSIIHDYTQEALVNSGFDQLISANDIDGALGTIVSALADKVLSSATGLLGASKSSSSGGSFTRELQDYSGSSASANQAALQLVQTQLGVIGGYASDWRAIRNSAQAALTSLNALDAACSTQSTAAQSALATQVRPMLSQADTALSNAASQQTLGQKIQSEAAGGSAGSTLSADIATFTGALVSAAEVTTVHMQASALGKASATPTGSLSVSGGTTVDQMNLLASNAQSLQATCGIVAAPPTGPAGP